jgi:hypothetical protein
MHPIVTGEALGQVGEGAWSKLQGLWEDQDPTAKAKQEAMFDAFAEPWTSVGGFKKALATDPFTVLSAASIPLSGGAGLLAKGADIAGTASALGRAAQIGSDVLKASSLAANPTGAAVAVAGKALGAVPGMVTKAQEFATGAPQYAFDKAAQVDSVAGPAAGDIKANFNAYATGQGDPVDLSRRITNAVGQMKNDAINDWKQTKGNITQATQPVPLVKVFQAIQEARDNLSSPNVAGRLAMQAHDAINEAEGDLWGRMISGDPNDLTLDGIDKFKQELWHTAKTQYTNPLASNALKTIHAGVRGALSDVSPQYDALMEQYQRINDDIQNVVKSTGASNKTAANTELARSMRALKTPQGQMLVDRLGQVDPTIPYSLAGSALYSSLPSGWSLGAEKGGMLYHLYNIGHAISTGSPSQMLLAASLPAIQATVQSPSMMGKLNRVAGTVAGSRVGQSVSGAARAVGAAAPAASALLTNTQAAQHDVAPPEQPPSGDNFWGQAKGGRVSRAAGGPVKKHMTHEQLVQRLLDLAEKAKKATNEDTKPLLKVPDETVVKALAVAQQAI